MKHSIPGLLLSALFITAGCNSRELSSSCAEWKIEAKTYQACFTTAYPPVNNDEDIVCVFAEEFGKTETSDPLFSDINTIDRCVDYLKKKNKPCIPPGKETGRTTQEAVKRMKHCTYDVVKQWSAPPDGDGCTRWKAAARYYTSCDPAVFFWPADSAQCVDDNEVANLTNGRFNSVDECADYIYSHAYPCAVPLGDDRTLCVNLLVHEIKE